MNRHKYRWCGGAALAGTAILAGPGPAAEGTADRSARVLEEIVVTATKRPESLQDVPVAVLR